MSWNVEPLKEYVSRNKLWKSQVNMIWHRCWSKGSLLDSFLSKRVNHGASPSIYQIKVKLVNAYIFFYSAVKSDPCNFVNKRQILLIGKSAISHQVILAGLLRDRCWARKRLIFILGGIYNLRGTQTHTNQKLWKRHSLGTPNTLVVYSLGPRNRVFERFPLLFILIIYIGGLVLLNLLPHSIICC